MKILWLTNYPLPRIADQVGLPRVVNEGWLVGLSELLIEKKWKIVLCSPLEKIQKTIQYSESCLKFYGIVNKNNELYNETLKTTFEEVLREEMPDIIHIMGSEFPHSFSMMEACKACGIENRCVVSIQGLISKIALAFEIGIDEIAKKKRILWDRIVKDSILLNKKKFIYRGGYEEKLLQCVHHVIGRTEWDYLCVKQINPTVHYYQGNEILRNAFYQNRWEYEKCEKHTIMISQATYPIKGFHILLRAVGNLVKKYPDIKLLVPSTTIYKRAEKRLSFFNSDYTNYILNLIKSTGLGEHIEFLGRLNEEEMCKAYQRANVCVIASTIENSSNSLGEAMLLGMPVVASQVGGLRSLMEHNQEGYFFPITEEYMLEIYIDKVFSLVDKAICMGQAAHIRAMETHNKERNVQNLIDCYKTINKHGEVFLGGYFD